MKNDVIIIDQRIEAPVDRVWKALTAKEEMERWFFEIEKFELEKGFTFTFNSGDEIQRYKHRCKILEVINDKKLSYSWRYSDVQGNSIVTYELVQDGEDYTLLKFKHEGIGTFPQKSFMFTRDSFMQGWNEIICNSLKEYVETYDD